MPIYPALAILIAAFVTRFWKAFELRPAYRRIIAIAFALVLVAGGLYSVASRALNRKPAEPIATLSRLAQSTAPADRAPLILLANKEHYYAQVPLFYSNRPVLQTYESSPPPPSQDAKRYVSFTRLADVVGDSEQPIIFPKKDTERLAQNYELRVIAEDRELVYGMIKRK